MKEKPADITKVKESEVRRGLVLHLDPEVLLSKGAVPSVPDDVRVRGQHFFVCLRSNGIRSDWMPLYTEDGPGRVEISAEHRTGHAKWVGGTTFYHPTQIWAVPLEALSDAAIAAHDKSTPTDRNRIDGAALPKAPASGTSPSKTRN